MLAGITANFTNSQAERPALITFQAATNVTIANSSLLNIQTGVLSSIIAFDSCSNITISNLTSTNCTADYILSSNAANQGDNSQLLVQSSHFSNGSAGAIWSSDQHLAVTDTVFDRLTATNTSLTDALLHHDNSNDSMLTIRNCAFSSNRNLRSASAATVLLSGPNLQLSESHFVNCTATTAIVSVGTSLTADGNLSTNDTVTIDSCNFADCTAEQGALYMHADSPLLSPQQLNLYHSSFTNNTAQYGGAVTLTSIGVVQVIDCCFDSNWAIWGLSAFYVYGGVQQATYFTMQDSVFTSNNGTRLKLADPNHSGITDITECGGLYLSSCKCIGISNSTFDSNIGLGLCIHGQMSSTPDCSNSDPVFFNQSTIATTTDKQLLDSFLHRYHHHCLRACLPGCLTLLSAYRSSE